MNDTQKRFEGVANLEFAGASVEHLPFCDGSFDFAFCVRVLHHGVRGEEAISELRPVSRAGVMLCIGDSLLEVSWRIQMEREPSLVDPL